MNKYNTATIRQLLTQAFTDEDFVIFCYDYYPSAYQKLSEGLSFQKKVQELIDYCDRNNLFDELLTQVKAVNPNKFVEFSSLLREKPQVKQYVMPQGLAESESRKTPIVSIFSSGGTVKVIIEADPSNLEPEERHRLFMVLIPLLGGPQINPVLNTTNSNELIKPKQYEFTDEQLLNMLRTYGYIYYQPPHSVA